LSFQLKKIRSNITTETQRTQRYLFSPQSGDTDCGEQIHPSGTIYIILLPTQFFNNQLHWEFDRAKQLRMIKSRSEVMSDFIRSVSPDRIKRKTLCALCVSVVKKDLTFDFSCGQMKSKKENQ